MPAPWTEPERADFLAKFAPTVTGWEDTAKAVTNAMQSIYLGKAKPADALNQAATEANKSLGK